MIVCSELICCQFQHLFLMLGGELVLVEIGSVFCFIVTVLTGIRLICDWSIEVLF